MRWIISGLAMFPLAFSLQAVADPPAKRPTQAVTWVEVVDLDYRDPSVRRCNGAFADLQSYLDCLAGLPVEPKLRRTPAQVKIAKQSAYYSINGVNISIDGKLQHWTPGSGPEPFPHLPPGEFPYPWPSRGGGLDPDLPFPPRHGGTAIPARAEPKEYIANADALNGHGAAINTAEGSIDVRAMRTLLETATCHSDLSRSGATLATLTIQPGRMIDVGAPKAIGGLACTTVIEVSGLKTLQAAMQAVRSLLTSHTPTLGRGDDDHFDEYIPGSLRGGPYVAIASACQTSDRIRLVLMPPVELLELGVDAEAFLTRAHSKFVDPVALTQLPEEANRLRAIQIATECESDTALVANTVAAVRSLNGVAQ